MPTKRPTAIVYIDGLNLYRQRLKGRNHLKWLDPMSLAQELCPMYEILEVKYFSALIKTTNGDFEPAYRQQMYLKKLQQSCDKVTVQLGSMRMDVRSYPSHPISFDSNGKLQTIKVIKLEEKGTDVAIAANFMADVAESQAAQYVLISNDSDFEPLIKLAQNRFHVRAIRVDSRKISEEIVLRSQFDSDSGRPRTWT